MQPDLPDMETADLLNLERQLRAAASRDKGSLSLLYKVKAERLKRGITSLPAAQ